MRCLHLMKPAVWLCIFLLAYPFSPPSTAYAAPELSNQAISDKIEDELLLDPGVLSTQINTATRDGIVTLSGQVNNILAKERAVRIAESVKGVRAIVDQIEVEPTINRSDDDVSDDIKSALLDDPATESYEVTVSVGDGKVTLDGSVDSYQERELAAQVAMGVYGVTAIDNQIDVDYKGDRTDYEIQQDIEQALQWNVYVDDGLIDVAVSSGKVELSGTVGSAAEKRLAQSISWVTGVNSVQAEDLEVAYWSRDKKLRADKYVAKTEEEVRQAVKDALLFDPRVMSFNVDVNVAGSVVTLRGTVDNLKAKRSAEQDAKNTLGVSYVSNRLKVRPDRQPTATTLAQKIRDAFQRDPYVERFDVTVTVSDGTAYLYGTVDSSFEKNRADDLASRVIGVLEVKNFLDVEDETPYLYDPYVGDGYINEKELLQYEARAPLKTDSQILGSIESELQWSPFVDADQIDVSVDKGIATLTGAVDSWAERRAATENAYEGGATLVENDLDVEYR